MAKLNDPFCALKEGRLGKVGEVLNMAKAMAITAINEQGTALDELELRAKEQKDYHDLYSSLPAGSMEAGSGVFRQHGCLQGDPALGEEGGVTARREAEVTR